VASVIDPPTRAWYFSLFGIAPFVTRIRPGLEESACHRSVVVREVTRSIEAGFGQ
jgi:hypothetical protein